MLCYAMLEMVLLNRVYYNFAPATTFQTQTSINQEIQKTTYILSLSKNSSTPSTFKCVVNDLFMIYSCIVCETTRTIDEFFIFLFCLNIFA